MKKFIVKRKYWQLGGERCDQTLFIMLPKSAMGGLETETKNLNHAFVFDLNDSYPASVYSECNGQTISGYTRQGGYSYYQELIEVVIQVVGVLK